MSEHKEEVLRDTAENLLFRVARARYDAGGDLWPTFTPDNVTADVANDARTQARQRFDDHQQILNNGTSRWDITPEEVDRVISVLSAEDALTLRERLELQSKRVADAREANPQAPVDAVDEMNPQTPVDAVDEMLFENAFDNPYDNPTTNT